MVLAMFDVNGVAAGGNVELSWLQTSNKRRRVQAIGFGGSAAAGDCKVALFYGDHKIGEFDNTTTADVVTKDHLRYISTNFVLGYKMPLRVEVITASGSTAYLTLVVKNVARKRGGY